jgi:putative intracellular protease/amidase/YHS domain-containing protein
MVRCESVVMSPPSSRRSTRRRHLLRACVGVPLAVAAGCAARAESTPTPIPPTMEMGGALPMPADRKIPVAFLLSSGAEVVDFAGPWGVFEYVDVPDADNPFTLYTVAESVTPLKVSGGLTVVPEHTFEDAPMPRVIIIPAQDEPSPATVAWLERAAQHADLTVAICTGAFLLAETRLLAGRRVTTHHGALNLLAADHPEFEVIRGARFVDDGNISSAGGLTSGIDLALHIVERYLGRTTAERTAHALEYQGNGWKDASSNAAYLQRPRLTGARPRCPVCEVELRRASLPGAPTERFRGRTYHFCSPDCKQRFGLSPEKFAEE